MPLTIPQRSSVVAGLQGYSREALPELDPSTSRRSFIGGLIKSVASALHDWYVALKRYADNEPFPQRASSGFLRNGWWRDVTKLAPLDAAAATGRVAITGVDGTIIPAGTELVGNNVTYLIDVSTAITAQTLVASTLTRSGTTAIFETTGDHFLATGMSVVVSGATQTEYNGTYTITVTAANEFTYTITGAPATPATGAPVMSATWAVAEVTANDTGQATNLDDGSFLTISTPPAGADATAIATFGGIGGGTEAEKTESYRARVLKALGTDFGMFTADEIEIVAKSVPGVTRVWVLKATENGTNGVYDGQVKIAFMRDDDANPYPSAPEVEAVRDKIYDLIRPAHTAEEDIMVSAPDRLDVDITIGSLLPSTASMRRAVIARLEQFFSESVDYATDIPLDAIKCAIYETYDREGRAKITSFTITLPAGDVSVGANELPALGDVTFS